MPPTLEEQMQQAIAASLETPPEEQYKYEPIHAEPVTWRTPVAYLFGNRAAIYAIASTPGLLWVGLLLVISAGFAREYDGEDLLHEPWHIAIPVGASLVTSFLLFCLCELHSRGRRVPRDGFWSRYRVFLTLYWMTAPLAWLYAIPVERSGTASEAITFNLLLLKIVSVWRVILITRVVSVIYDVRWWGAIFAVLLFGSAVMLAVLSFTPLPLFSIMGGIRLSEGERELASFAFGMKLLSFPIMGISFIGMLLVLISKQNRWRFATIPARFAVPRWFWVIPAAALAIWIPLLPKPQREQQLRYVVEQDLRRGNIEAALTTLAAHDRSEFPPHWDPPPRIGYGEEKPRVLKVLNALARQNGPNWVREIYEEKFELRYRESVSFSFREFQRLETEEYEELLRYLEIVDPTSTMLNKLKESLKFYSESPINMYSGNPPEYLSPEERQRIDNILSRIPAE